MISTSECIQGVKDLYKSSDRIRSLLTAIGGDSRSNLDDLLKNLDCRPCGRSNGEGNARAFIVDNPVNIVLCTNRLQIEDLEEVLVHEMTHAYDYKFNRYDLSTCEGLAASEVRAAREAECHRYAKHLPQFAVSWCIKSKASAATNNIFPGRGSECVERAYSDAVVDLSPN